MNPDLLDIKLRHVTDLIGDQVKIIVQDEHIILQEQEKLKRIPADDPQLKEEKERSEASIEILQNRITEHESTIETLKLLKQRYISETETGAAKNE